ncbi:MAG: hypothetical protein LUC83_08465 [Clostridiales bacterium]|nr:hypothetical protein [Clostridiales bacterium]
MSVTAKDVLASLFNPTENVCFRVFDDKKGGIFQGAKLSCECGKYATIEETLKNHNALNRGIFYVVNYGGQEDSSISRINAQFVEMDTGSFEEQQKKVDDFPLPPSMIIKTQKSLHIYWFMDASAKVEMFRKVQKQLVQRPERQSLIGMSQTIRDCVFCPVFWQRICRRTSRFSMRRSSILLTWAVCTVRCRRWKRSVLFRRRCWYGKRR